MTVKLTAVPYPYTAVIRTNYVPNPRVATNLTSWSTYAGAGGVGAIGGPYDISSPPADVPWSNKHVGYSQTTAATDGAGPAVTAPGIAAGKTYTASGYMRPNASRSVRVVIDWYNASSGYISGVFGSPVAATAGQWSRVSVTAVAPAGAVSANVGFRDATATPAGRTVDVTCAQLEDAGTLGAYFDGSSPDDDGAIGRLIYWTGAAHASASKDERRTPTAAAFVVSPQFPDGSPAMLTITDAMAGEVTVHRLIGSRDPVVVVTIPPSSRRAGAFDFWCKDRATADTLAKMLTSSLIMLTDSVNPSLGMYLVTSNVRRADDASRWRVSADFQEVALGSAW